MTNINLMNDDTFEEISEDEPSAEIKELMKNHDLDKETAEHVQEIIEDLGVGEDDAIALSDVI